jgi:hypothetical protein
MSPSWNIDSKKLEARSRAIELSFERGLALFGGDSERVRHLELEMKEAGKEVRKELRDLAG